MWHSQMITYTKRSTALWPKTFHMALRILTVSKYISMKVSCVFYNYTKLNTQKKDDLHKRAPINGSWLKWTATFAKKRSVLYKAMAVLPTQEAHVTILNYNRRSIFYSICFCNGFSNFFWESPVPPPFVTSQIPVICARKISSSWHFSYLQHHCQS